MIFSGLKNSRKNVFNINFLLLVQCITSGIFSAISSYLIILLYKGAIFLPSFKASLNNSMLGSGFVILLFQAYLIICPLIGIYSDRIGRKKWLILAISSAAVGYSLILIGLYKHNLACFVIGLLFQGVSNIDFPIILASLTDIVKNKTRVSCFALIQLLMLALPIAAEAANYYLTNQASLFSAVFILLSLISCLQWINLGFAYFCLSEPLQRRLPLLLPDNAIETIMEEFFRIFSKKDFLSICSLLFLVYFLWGIYFQSISSFLVSTLHWHKLPASIFFNIKIFIFAIVTLFLPWLTRYISVSRLLKIATVLLSVSAIAWGIFPYTSVQWLVMVPFSTGVALSIPLLWLALFKQALFLRNGFIAALIGISWALAWESSGAITQIFLQKDYVFRWLPCLIGVAILLLSKLINTLETIQPERIFHD